MASKITLAQFLPRVYSFSSYLGLCSILFVFIYVFIRSNLILAFNMVLNLHHWLKRLFFPPLNCLGNLVYHQLYFWTLNSFLLCRCYTTWLLYPYGFLNGHSKGCPRFILPSWETGSCSTSFNSLHCKHHRLSTHGLLLLAHKANSSFRWENVPPFSGTSCEKLKYLYI